LVPSYKGPWLSKVALTILQVHINVSKLDSSALSSSSVHNYCRHHSTIEHSSLHPHLHHINTCTYFTKRSVIEINGAMWSLLYELKVEIVLKLLI